MTSQDNSQTQIPAATLRALTGIGAAGLFAFGVFCWIAANWSSFHRLTKLELIAGLLLASARPASSPSAYSAGSRPTGRRFTASPSWS